MKGGGFIVIVFLLICFLWGVTSIVGGIRKLITPKQASLSKRHNSDDETGTHPINTHPAQNPTAGPQNDEMAHTLDQLQKASDLHRDGLLSDEQLQEIKSKIVQRI
ncbi:hypothetical protein [Oryzisolibacter sp. LB2S]|uniref:hypothetical protein n=1 Tax=Alicycliphilus soli TaxID=3228789 RepID=UPI003458EB3A